MREIKFRAWDKSNMEVLDLDPDAKIFYTWEKLLEHQYMPGDPHVDLLFEQFTGLHDKHGKEIYEGDIVTVQCGSEESDRSSPALVELVYGCWSNSGSHLFGCKAHEIIGNVHENMDLLDGTTNST